MDELREIIREFLIDRYGEEGLVIAILLAILYYLNSRARSRRKPWMRALKGLVYTLIALASIFTFCPSLYKWQRDLRYSFEDTNGNTINLLIPDFDSVDPKAGQEFTDRFFENLISRTAATQTLKIGDRDYNIRIDVKRTNEVWTEEEIRKRGERRGADLGVIGTFIRYTTKDSTTYDVDSLYCIVLDTSLAAVIEYQEPVESLYDLSVRLDALSKDGGLTLMAGRVSDPILYLSRLAVNLQLLKIAYREKNLKLRLQILQKVNDGFAEIAGLLGSPAITAFHRGNSHFRNAQLSAKPYQAGIYLDAAANYYESIVAYQKNSGLKVIKYDPVKPYFNLAETYRQIYELTEERAWLDSTRAVYERAENDWPSQITTQELLIFLEEYLEIHYALGRIDTSEFNQHVEKYLQCNKALSNYVTQSDKLHEQRQSEARALTEKRQSWEARQHSYKPKPYFLPVNRANP